jgi:hypothetical protein
MPLLWATHKEEIMFRQILAVAFGVAISIPGVAAQSQKPANNQNESFDVRSSIGDAHLGADADARKAGLPLYPGARLRRDKENKENNDAVNIGVLTEAFGFKLVVANYESDDDPGKVIDFYRDKLKRYGKVLECHSMKHGDDVDFGGDDKDDDSKGSKELKCDGDNTGPVTELKVGREDNQRVVAVEANQGRKGSTFAVVYVHARGKQGDI